LFTQDALRHAFYVAGAGNAALGNRRIDSRQFVPPMSGHVDS
jgi:hypothetical protein